MAVLKYTDNTDTLSFSGPTTAITTSFSAQQGEMRIDNRAQVALLIDYTSGDETELELLTELSPLVTFPLPAPPGTPALGTDFYAISTITGGVISESIAKFNTTGKFRVPTPLLHQERVMRLSVRRNGGTDAGAGSIAVKVVDDSHLVTSALTGRQP